MRIVLTPYEMEMCAKVGRDRFANAIKLGRNAGQGPSNSGGEEYHVRGARCEFAASIALNLSWRPCVGQIDQRDVGGIIEVRSTELAHGCLIVKPKDDDGAPFLLVLHEPPVFAMRGWIMARDAKARPLKTEHGDPAHFVKQGELRQVEELRLFAHRRMER